MMKYMSINFNFLFLFIGLGCSEKTQYVPPEEEGTVLIDSDQDGHYSDEDCDDTNPTVNSGADEICDGLDNNCDGQADEDVTTTFYGD